LLCQTAATQGVFCKWCTPDTCLNCTASHVRVTKESVTCSHGCETPLHEYTAQKLFTVILNAPRIERLTYAGPRVELIIPNGTQVTAHATRPDPAEIPDDHIVAPHYSRTADEILETGVSYPPHERTPNHTETYTGTVRDRALFAWPYTPEYVDAQLSWPDDNVFFEIPEHAVHVSSYRFLDMVVDDDTVPYTVPTDKYNRELTFTVTELRNAVETHNRPCSPDDLFI